jgi:hypothetical protein
MVQVSAVSINHIEKFSSVRYADFTPIFDFFLPCAAGNEWAADPSSKVTKK